MASRQFRKKGAGRPAKLRVVPDHIIGAFNLTADRPVPQSPPLLIDLVKAILDRIERISSKEGKLLRAYVHYLAAIEQDTPPPLNESSSVNAIRRRLKHHLYIHRYRTEMTEGVLKNIRYPKHGRMKDHLDPTIEFQYHLLQRFLTEFPYTASYNAEWWQYLSKHWEDLTLLLTIVPCLCTYNKSLSTAPRDSFESPLAESDFIQLTLAHLHQCSTRTIRSGLS